MQTITVELNLNAAFYKEHFRNGDMTKEEMRKELRREIKDQVNELNIGMMVDFMIGLPALALNPRIVLTTES